MVWQQNPVPPPGSIPFGNDAIRPPQPQSPGFGGPFGPVNTTPGQIAPGPFGGNIYTASGGQQFLSVPGATGQQGGSTGDLFGEALRLAFGQTQFNQSTAGARDQLNRFNEVNPLGSSTFAYGPDGRLIRQNQLSPDEAQRLDYERAFDSSRNQLASQLFTQATSPLKDALSFDGITEVPGLDAFDDQRRAVEDALFQREARILEPQLERERAEKLAELRARGIDEGNPQYFEELQRLDDRQARQLENIRLNAVAGGTAEQERLRGFAERDRNREIQEMFTLRQTPFQELAQVLAQNTGARLPQFQAAAPVSMGDVNFTDPFLNMLGIQSNETLTREQLAQQQALQDMQLAVQQSNLAQQLASQEKLTQLQLDQQADLFNQGFQNDLQLLGITNAQQENLINLQQPSLEDQLLDLVGTVGGAFAGNYFGGRR
jgi:hypothetical protein